MPESSELEKDLTFSCVAGGDREAPRERCVLHRARQGGPSRLLWLHHVGRGGGGQRRAQVLARVLDRLHGQNLRDSQGRLRGVLGRHRLVQGIPPGPLALWNGKLETAKSHIFIEEIWFSEE